MPEEQRPRPGEYDDYYQAYIEQVPDGEIVSILERQISDTVALLADVSEERAGYRYRPGRWSLKEVVGHVLDTERVFAYRALSFARSDPAPLPSMDQDHWASSAPFGRRSLPGLLSEFELVRRANVALFSSFTDYAMLLRGRASGNEFTVRAILYIIAGHELHHRKVLAEKYLS